MIDYPAILSVEYPGTRWTHLGEPNDYSGISWDQSNPNPKPTKADLDAAAPSVQYKREMNRVRRARHADYAAAGGPDAIFLQWQRGDATEQDWLDAVQAVKEAHPYPEQP
jgi:hypothetical protein